MTSEFEITTRPENVGKRQSGRPRDAITSAIRATATGGGAVRVPMNGEPYGIVTHRLVNRLSLHARRSKLSIRTQQDVDGSLLIWLEPRATS